MKKVVYLIAITLSFTFFSSCQKEFSQEGAASFDSDAQLFITNANITDAGQQASINNLVVQLKQDTLWTKFAAIYPMVGGTSFSTKWNLKDPRDMDDAYRISWNGAPAFKATGVTCLTTNDWGDTHLKDNVLKYNNASMSFYSGTQNQIAGYDMGCSNNIPPYNIMAIYEDFNEDIVNTFFNNYGTSSYQPAVTTGLFTNSSYEGQVVRYDNGISVSQYGAPENAYTNTAITIGKIFDIPIMGLRECRFAAIGEGLSAAQALKFYTAVKNFQTNLSR